MPDLLPNAGFHYVGLCDGSTSSLKEGDILVIPDNHTEVYIGNGYFIGAHSNYDHNPGDGSGREICVDTSSKQRYQIWRQ